MDMPEDSKQPVSTDETSASVGTDDTSSAVTQDDINVPKARLDEVLTKNKSLQKKLADFEAKQKKARDEELAKQGEYKTLLEEREQEIQSLRKDNERLILIEQAEREELLSKIPEDKREKYNDTKYGNDILRDLASEFTKPTQPKMVNDQMGAGRMSDLTQKAIDTMAEDEKKSRWLEIVQFYKNKSATS